ncbi:GPW/gp25 family protein [Serratia sp. JSRIV001]|uniref:GPW/gp25 family protein n=1 Tax=unclassified Serratia (in: enterobacteria) TaxID=2647522 RepID=UPI001CBDBF3C|nr:MULTISPECIES: GPW/gp25 family protein [unclassified Serratia (in: enterobacteria)]UAN45166.1 GPW/gp25 family protein [Serratia sp. JSRIV001]UAN50673.1 GPW/gp25 family protein [Serratia sp. JSRIV002]UAN56630.1 GPW/gp25 family protein [Serratia sp. JSRIV004]
MPSLLLRLSDNNPDREEDSFLEENNNWLLNELGMLFSSCSRLAFLEDISLVNCSVLNYGINASVTQLTEFEQQKRVIEQRIKNALHRFEPRLTHVAVKAGSRQTAKVMFDIQAQYREEPMLFQLVWDECASRISLV